MQLKFMMYSNSEYIHPFDSDTVQNILFLQPDLPRTSDWVLVYMYQKLGPRVEIEEKMSLYNVI